MRRTQIFLIIQFVMQKRFHGFPQKASFLMESKIIAFFQRKKEKTDLLLNFCCNFAKRNPFAPII